MLSEREIRKKIFISEEIEGFAEFKSTLKQIEERLRWIPLRIFTLQVMKEDIQVIIGEEAKNNVLIEMKTKAEELSSDLDPQEREHALNEVFEVIEFMRKRIVY
jgi:hypothetical protein